MVALRSPSLIGHLLCHRNMRAVIAACRVSITHTLPSALGHGSPSGHTGLGCGEARQRRNDAVPPWRDAWQGWRASGASGSVAACGSSSCSWVKPIMSNEEVKQSIPPGG